MILLLPFLVSVAVAFVAPVPHRLTTPKMMALPVEHLHDVMQQALHHHQHVTAVATDTPTLVVADASSLEATMDALQGGEVPPLDIEAGMSDKNNDWFDPLVKLVETAIVSLHGLLGSGSYGIAIILFTCVVKLVTFPLNYAQLESTTKMQALNPAIKKIQATYQSDPQQMNTMMASLYQENNLNPLAGCLPSLAQIPIFIALYRALFNLAKEDLLEEPFLWLPNLEGPVFGAQNADWLFNFDKWNGFEPPLGWHDTLMYLSLPVLLIIAQSISGRLLQMGTQNQPGQEVNSALLTFLPFMVGFFALNVPCSLSLYWLSNNIITTALTVGIKSAIASNAVPVTMGGQPLSQQTFDVAPSSQKRSPVKSRSKKQIPAAKKKIAPPPPVEQEPIAFQAPLDISDPLPTTVMDSTTTTDGGGGGAVDDEDGVPSRAAEKKIAKASKTRRAKKSRRR